MIREIKEKKVIKENIDKNNSFIQYLKIANKMKTSFEIKYPSNKDMNGRYVIEIETNNIKFFNIKGMVSQSWLASFEYVEDIQMGYNGVLMITFKEPITYNKITIYNPETVI